MQRTACVQALRKGLGWPTVDQRIKAAGCRRLPAHARLLTTLPALCCRSDDLLEEESQGGMTPGQCGAPSPQAGLRGGSAAAGRMAGAAQPRQQVRVIDS